MTNDSLTSKWSDRRMEGGEGLRTVESLRGRLLAERAASKAANDESDQISKKVVELERQLKIEIRSRNKAEKRLKFLMKKLDSLNISSVSADESSEKSEISSVSSSKSQPQLQKIQFSDISKRVMNTGTSEERHNCPSFENNLGSLDKTNSENSKENVSKEDGIHEYDLQKEDTNGSKSFFIQNDNDNEEHDQDTYHNVDNSMALIMVEENSISKPRNEEVDDMYENSMAFVVADSMVKMDKKDVLISNRNVRDVLDALRYARECLQVSMDMKRHMKSNIAQPRLDRISC